MSWDPRQYGRYGSERARPLLDLLGRVPLAAPQHVVDLGCGSGAAFAPLRARFPATRITGIDADRAMLGAAGEAGLEVELVCADAAEWVPDRPPDLIFSNAALHWLDDHELLFPRLVGLLAPGGVLAVQMPVVWVEPFHVILDDLAKAERWKARFAEVERAGILPDRKRYAAILAPMTTALDIWETRYLHRLQGENAVYEWIKGTSLKPFLDALEDQEREEFAAAYAGALAAEYPVDTDGLTPFWMRRLFVVATARR